MGGCPRELTKIIASVPMWPILVAWHFDHVHAQRLRPAGRAVDRRPTAASVTAVTDLSHAAGHVIVMARRRNSAAARRCCSASMPNEAGSGGSRDSRGMVRPSPRRRSLQDVLGEGSIGRRVLRGPEWSPRWFPMWGPVWGPM